MVLKIVIAIFGVLAATGVFTAAMVWLASASISRDPTVAQRLRFVEILISIAMTAMFLAPAFETSKDRRWGLTVVGLVLVAWIFRGVKFLQTRGKT